MERSIAFMNHSISNKDSLKNYHSKLLKERHSGIFVFPLKKYMKSLKILLATINFSQIKLKSHFITHKWGDFLQNLVVQVIQIIQSKIFNIIT